MASHLLGGRSGSPHYRAADCGPVVRRTESLEATPVEWLALMGLAFGSMFFGFFAWYKGLAMLGTAYGSQVQQLQSLMTLGWSALLLGETVTLWTLVAALGVIASVLWAQRSRAKKT